MSIYKKEASLAEMRQEAVRRMELLGLESRKFARGGPVSLSQQIGSQVFLQPADEEINRRTARFEREYECLVYHVLLSDNPFAGECWSLLFVSPTSSDWESERAYIADSKLVYAYVESTLEDGISEIMVDSRDGGLIRLG